MACNLASSNIVEFPFEASLATRALAHLACPAGSPQVSPSSSASWKPHLVCYTSMLCSSFRVRLAASKANASATIFKNRHGNNYWQSLQWLATRAEGSMPYGMEF